MHGFEEKVNFFISYTGSDTEYARWIAWELAREDLTYRLQEEHYPPGSRFIYEMGRWLQNAEHVLAIISPAYFNSRYAMLEMNSGITEDPLGERRRVIPVRVEEGPIPAILKDLVYIDFVGKSQDEARRALIAGVRAARVGSNANPHQVRKRPEWPEGKQTKVSSQRSISENAISPKEPVKIQYLACDVGRGLDFIKQYKKINNALKSSIYAERFEFKAEFDVTDTNLFNKLNAYRPHVVHFSGNQNGGNVLFPSSDGAEVVVSDEALAGLLSSLGVDVRIAIIDTCESIKCARRVSDVVECTFGVSGEIFDEERRPVSTKYCTRRSALANPLQMRMGKQRPRCNLSEFQVNEYQNCA